MHEEGEPSEESQEQREELGRKGGSAAMVGGRPMARETAEVVWWTAPVTRWGPVWSGFVVALGIQFVLSALGVAFAITGLDITSENFAASMSIFLSVWVGISLLIALFFGGWIAGRGGALMGMNAGWFQGTVLWALVVLFGLIFGGAVTSGLLGTAASVVPAVLQSMQVGIGEIEQTSALAAISTAATTVWILFIASVIQWFAAAFGGWLGASRVARTEST